MNSHTATAPVFADTVATSRAAAIPWYCLAAVLGATCIPIGALWDISWHSTIGRDTFWTPAHIMIHLGGLIPAFAASFLIFRNTFFVSAEHRVPGVKIWGFHGPVGAWVIVWGALSMLLSAPFDDWWHNAYGLDVEILSPPHVVLAMGMYAVAIGALLLVLSWQNRMPHSRAWGWVFVYAAGVLLTMSTIIVMEESYPNLQRTATFYTICCMFYTTYLAGTARAANVRWAATGAAATYTFMLLAMNWVLPLFKAQPLLAPIYNPVDRMVPPGFPILLIFPAVAIDLVMMSFRKRGFWWDTLLAVMVGTVFFLVLFAVQWNFSKFMISPAADNWFFVGNRWWPYWVHTDAEHWFRYWRLDSDPMTVKAAFICIGLACLKSRISIGVANWMKKVQR